MPRGQLSALDREALARTRHTFAAIGYVYEGLTWAGLPLNKKIGFAIAVPVVMLIVWRVIHGVKRRVHRE